VSVAASPVVIDMGSATRDSAGGGTGGGEFIRTITDWDALPPGPVHFSSNVLSARIAPLDSLPDVGLGPDQAFEAVHEVASVADQFSVVAAPGETKAGSAESERLGAAAAGNDVSDDPPPPLDPPPQPVIKSTITQETVALNPCIPRTIRPNADLFIDTRSVIA
jgi:hypothetical protein